MENLSTILISVAVGFITYGVTVFIKDRKLRKAHDELSIKKRELFDKEVKLYDMENKLTIARSNATPLKDLLSDDEYIIKRDDKD